MKSEVGRLKGDLELNQKEKVANFKVQSRRVRRTYCKIPPCR